MTDTVLFCSFFFNDTATTEIYTLSLHDALPISQEVESVRSRSLRHGRSYQHRDRAVDAGRSRGQELRANQDPADHRPASRTRAETVSMGYRPPSWLAGAHAQTIYPALFKPPRPPRAPPP